MKQNINHQNDKPLVTLALFAYNQEKYIKEAVHAAFAQQYERLEIILSDDFSNDNTYGIMKELVDDYKGKHRVKLIKNTVNEGVFNHVIQVGKISAGELIVMSAGDDISKPDRVQRIVEEYLKSNAVAFYSSYDLIDEVGSCVAENCISLSLDPKKHAIAKYFDTDEVNVVHGATSAYSKVLFERLERYYGRKIFSEDGVFTFLIALFGEKVEFINKSLVLYRAHSESLTNDQIKHKKRSFTDIKKTEIRNGKYLVSVRARCELFLEMIADFPENEIKSKVKKDNIINEILAIQDKLNFEKMNFLKKNANLFNSFGKEQLIWKIQRLFGLNFLVLLRLIKNRIGIFCHFASKTNDA